MCFSLCLLSLRNRKHLLFFALIAAHGIQYQTYCELKEFDKYLKGTGVFLNKLRGSEERNRIHLPLFIFPYLFSFHSKLSNYQILCTLHESKCLNATDVFLIELQGSEKWNGIFLSPFVSHSHSVSLFFMISKIVSHHFYLTGQLNMLRIRYFGWATSASPSTVLPNS